MILGNIVKRAHFAVIIREMGVLAAYTGVTLLLTLPLIQYFAIHLIGGGDAPWFVWDLWLFKRIIRAAQFLPLTTDMVYHPAGEVPFIWSSPINEILGAALQIWLPPIIVYNSLALLTFALSGYTTYWLSRYFLSNTPHKIYAAFIAGLIYAFSPYHFAHIFEGHLNIATIQWLPLAVLGAFVLYNTPSWRTALLAATGMTLVALSSNYYIPYFILIFGAVFGTYHLWRDRADFFRREFWLWAFVSGVIMLLLITPFYLPFLHSAEQSADVMDDLSDYVFDYGADLLAFITPSALHPLLGKFSSPLYQQFTSQHYPEMTVFLGYIALLLSIGAFIGKRHRAAPFWGLLGLVGLVFALGPYLHIAGRRLIPLPYMIFTKLPFLKFFRVPSRCAVTAILAAAVLSGFTLQRVFAALPRYRVPIFIGLSILIPLESIYAFPFRTFDMTVPDFYHQMGRDPEEYAILELPAFPLAYQGYQIYHGKKLVNGLIPRAPRRVEQFIHEDLYISQLTHPKQMQDNPQLRRVDIFYKPRRDSGNTDTLRQHNIRYVLLHRVAPDWAMPAEEYQVVRNLLNSSLGQPVHEAENLLVYETPRRVSTLGAVSPEHAPHLALGYRWHEGQTYVNGMPARDMTQNGTIFINANITEHLRLSLDIAAYIAPITVTVYADDNLIAETRLATPRQPVGLVTDPFLVTPGQNEIKLHTEPACAENDSNCRSIAAQNVRIVRAQLPVSPTYSISANFDNRVRLLGYDLETTTSAYRVTLYWECLRDMETDYTVFAHLLDERGEMLTQSDGYPLNGKHPTSGWQRGEVVIDTITLPRAARDDHLAVGMYDLETLKRLPRVNTSETFVKIEL